MTQQEQSFESKNVRQISDFGGTGTFPVIIRVNRIIRTHFHAECAGADIKSGNNQRLPVGKAAFSGFLVRFGRSFPPVGPIPKPILPLSEIGVDRWQYDLWYLIVKAAIDGDSTKVDLDKLPGLNKPAASRYAATTPTLLNWFKIHNAGRSYRDQVKPFNFLLSFHAGIEFRDTRPIAAYDRDIKRASKKCFDRNTSLPLSSGALKTYREILAQYHLHPEAKFENGITSKADSHADGISTLIELSTSGKRLITSKSSFI